MNNFITMCFNGLYWVGKGGFLLNESVNLLTDIQEIQEKEAIDTMIKDYVKVAAQIGTVVLDCYVLAKDWQRSSTANGIKIKKGDIEKLQEELKRNTIASAKFQAMGLLTSMVHNTTKDYPIIDINVLIRMISFALVNGQLNVEDRSISTIKTIICPPIMAAVSKIALSHFDRWYQLHGPNAPQISFDNLDYDDIPDEYHDNPIFSQFICPITHSPIRYPVTAPNRTGGPDYHFERKTIVDWLQRKPTNPLTNLPLRLNEIRENLDMRQVIEVEMRKLNLIEIA